MESSGPHVGVIAFPFGTHAAPLLAAIRRIATSASSGATFSFFNTSESNNSIFGNKASCEKVRGYDVWDGVADGYVFTGNPQERIELFMKAAPQSLRLSIAAAEADAGKALTCLVTDAFFWFAADMAEEMGVPWVAFWTAGPSSLSTHFYTHLIRHKLGAGSGNKETKLSFIPGMSKIVVEDLPEGVVFGNLESLFSRMLVEMGLMLPRASATFINSFEELDKTITDDLSSKLNNFLNIGPFNLVSAPTQPLEKSCLCWLDKQKEASAVYISFGSVIVPPEAELIAIAEALEGTGVPFIWSLRNDNIANAKFVERTKEHGLVVPWAPQKEILSHVSVGAFITHCGWNSVLESIGGGVPMICRPFFGDQRVNGKMVEDVWEIGVRIQHGVFTKERVETCLNVVLCKEEGNIMRQKINSLKKLAIQAVGPRGTSTNNFMLLQDIITKPTLH